MLGIQKTRYNAGTFRNINISSTSVARKKTIARNALQNSNSASSSGTRKTKTTRSGSRNRASPSLQMIQRSRTANSDLSSTTKTTKTLLNLGDASSNRADSGSKVTPGIRYSLRGFFRKKINEATEKKSCSLQWSGCIATNDTGLIKEVKARQKMMLSTCIYIYLSISSFSIIHGIVFDAVVYICILKLAHGPDIKLSVVRNIWAILFTNDANNVHQRYWWQENFKYRTYQLLCELLRYTVTMWLVGDVLLEVIMV